MRLDLFVKLKY